MKKTLFITLLTSSFVAGCIPQPQEHYRLDGKPRTEKRQLLQQKIQTPYKGDGGITIVKTDTVGAASAIDVNNPTPDCAGNLGLGVWVESSQAQKAYLFDKNGNPCDKAKVIFNGRDKVHQRATPQDIGISFIDALGPLPAQQQQVLNVAPIQLLDNYEPVYEGEPDNFEKMLDEWNNDRAQNSEIRQKEKLLADIRDVSRLSSRELIDDYQRKISELTVKLRQAEKKSDYQQNKERDLIAKLNAIQNKAESESIIYNNETAKLTGDLEKLRFRLKKTNEAKNKIRHQYSKREDIYKKHINEISTDLRDAEAQASSSRQAIVMEAAKRIAEAERLAYAARVVEKDAMEREASRLKREADTLMNRAINLGKGRQIILPGMTNIPDFQQQNTAETKDETARSPLESLPVVLREEDETLENIFNKALKSIQPKAGNWRIAWELSTDNMGIPLEEWSIVAETPFNEFLSYVAKKVKQTHNVQLKFERFDEHKLFVVSD